MASVNGHVYGILAQFFKLQPIDLEHDVGTEALNLTWEGHVDFVVKSGHDGLTVCVHHINPDAMHALLYAIKPYTQGHAAAWIHYGEFLCPNLVEGAQNIEFSCRISGSIAQGKDFYVHADIPF